MAEVAIRLPIEPLEEGGYVAASEDVPGLVADGRSIAGAAEIAPGLARKIAESCLEHGDPLPPALAHLSNDPLDEGMPRGIIREAAVDIEDFLNVLMRSFIQHVITHAAYVCMG